MVGMDAASVRDYATEAIRYWEPRRIIYNAVLGSVVLICFFLSPGPNRSVSFDQVQLLFLLCAGQHRLLRCLCGWPLCPDVRVPGAMAQPALVAVRGRVALRGDPGEVLVDRAVCVRL